jgi:glycosyltransferase involved in cell wall biosynthesis
MNKALVVISGGGRQGGAERRFSRAFASLVQRDPTAHYLINRELYEAVRRNGWLAADTPNVHVLTNWRWLPQYRGRVVYLVVHMLEVLWLIVRLRLRLLHFVSTAVHVGAVAAFVSGVRTIVSIISVNFKNVYSPASLPLYRRTLRAATLVDVLSNSIIQYVLASPASYPGLMPKLRVTACSFTDYTRFVPAPTKEPWVVYSTSAFVEVKNPLLAAAVACQLVERHPAVQVFLLGRGGLEAAMRERIAQCPHHDRISLRHEDDVSATLARASVYLSIQAVENYPTQALLEAMAAGCAIVATDVGDTRLLVDETVGAVLPPDAEPITQAALDLLNDPARCAQLGAAARQRATTQHTVERMVDYLQALYADALGEQPSASARYKPKPHV